MELTQEQALNVIVQAANMAHMSKQDHMAVETAMKVLLPLVKKPEVKVEQGVEFKAE